LKKTAEEYMYMIQKKLPAKQIGKLGVEVVIARCEVETVSLIYDVILIFKFLMSSTY
jgi:hypothetical protein